MDDAEHLMPRYLRFVRGVIRRQRPAAERLARAAVEQGHRLDPLRLGQEGARPAEEIAKNEPEKYATFWQEFGRVLEGRARTTPTASRLRSRCASPRPRPRAEVLPADYVARMKEGQTAIYYITGRFLLPPAKNSPHLEVFRKKGIEVLLMSERVDSG